MHVRRHYEDKQDHGLLGRNAFNQNVNWQLSRAHIYIIITSVHTCTQCIFIFPVIFVVIFTQYRNYFCYGHRVTNFPCHKECFRVVNFDIQAVNKAWWFACVFLFSKIVHSSSNRIFQYILINLDVSRHRNVDVYGRVARVETRPGNSRPTGPIISWIRILHYVFPTSTTHVRRLKTNLL